MKFESEILRAHPFLSLVPRFTLRRLLAKAPLDEYPKGTIVYRQGNPCEAVYLIFSGRCESRRSEGRGMSEVEEILGPGDTLGDRELLQGEAYRSTVAVATDSLLVRFEARDLRRIFAKNPAIAGRVSQSIVERVEARRERRAQTGSRLRRIASVMSLDSKIACGTVAEDIAGALGKLGSESVLLLRLLPGGGESPLADWDCVTRSLNGDFCFAEKVRPHPGGFSELRLNVGGDALEATRVAPLLSHVGQHFDLVLVHVAPETPMASTLEVLIQSDFTYLLARPEEGQLHDCKLLLGHVAAQADRASVRMRPVLCVDEKRTKERDDFERSMRESGRPVYAWLPGYPRQDLPGSPDGYARQIRSLARDIAGCRIGLALSSGGAKGLAHIGVIQILEEHGIEIDMVAGSSMGAYVGAVWASGYSGLECEKIARTVPEGRFGLLALMQFELPPRRGFLKTARVAHRLRHSVRDRKFSDLHVPLRVVATYLDTLERVVFSTGDVVSAVEASIAIPGICVPVKIDGQTYVDGGIVDPLPVDVLREAGMDYVIAVNTIPTPDTRAYCLGIEREHAEQEKDESRVGRFLNRQFNYFASGNVLDTMFRSVNGAQTRIAEASCLGADIVLRPVTCDGRWHDFASPGKYVALGRKVTEDRIEEILALVPKKKEVNRAIEIAA